MGYKEIWEKLKSKECILVSQNKALRNMSLKTKSGLSELILEKSRF